MMRGFASRRRAEELEAILSGRTAVSDGTPAEVVALLELVSSLRSVPPVEARPEYVADLRSRLMEAAATELAPAAPAPRSLDPETTALLTPRQRKGARERRLATAIGGFAVVAASGSMAMASGGALPGDALYPVKRAIENVQTNLQSDDTERAAVLLGHAETRLVEVQELTALDASAGEIATTLDDFTDQTSQATELVLDDYETTGDAEPVTRLREFTDRSMSQLTAIGEDLPAEARPALISAAQTIRQVDTVAFQACPTCGDAPITELPDFSTRSLEELITPNGASDPTASALRTRAEGEAERRGQEDQPAPTGKQSTETDSTEEAPVDDAPVPDGPLAPDDDGDPSEDPKLVDDVTRGLKNAGVKDNDGDGDQDLSPLTDGVVDGVSGLVDGLTGGE